MDVIIVPRVLAHSVETMKKRLNQLRSIGVYPKNLNVLCLSKREFQKYLMARSKNDLEVDQQLYEHNKYSVTKQ
jgi:lipoate synthase